MASPFEIVGRLMNLDVSKLVEAHKVYTAKPTPESLGPFYEEIQRLHATVDKGVEAMKAMEGNPFIKHIIGQLATAKKTETETEQKSE